jgi:hypothetical protein
VHAQVASQLESELKARPSLLGACLECPKLKLELDAHSLNVKKLETKLLEKSHVSVSSSPCKGCVPLKCKLVHATNENTMLVQDVAYLTLWLMRTKLSEKIIEENLSRVDECVTRSIHKLGLGYERCEDKGEISTKFVPISTYNDEEETIKAKQIPYPPNPKPSFNPKRGVKTESPKPREEVFICMFCGHVGHLDEFCFGERELRGGVLDMLETHIVMSSLISRLVLILMFRLAFTLVLRLALLRVLFLSSLMDLTIAHMVLVHERTALSLDALDTAHVLIVVIVSRVGLVSLLKGLTLTLSRDIWMAHIFPVVVHVPLGQILSWKGL